ncbi:hypothetical protein [Ignatzschineria indica]|uniref:hypothetical protein n=1 Tax=Ignatzschineria indica TaxID=472583 RepID=UPI0036363E11
MESNRKARLRALRAEVNFMAMTATPIPRTLNMGLTGLKERSPLLQHLPKIVSRYRPLSMSGVMN